MDAPPCRVLRDPPQRSASAAGTILAAVESGRGRHFIVDRARLDACAAIVADVTRRRYPDARDSVPQPLAPFRGGRRRPRGGTRPRARGRARRSTPRSRASTSRSSACCSTPAPAVPGRYARDRRRSLRPLGGSRRRELPRVHGGDVLVAHRDDPLRADATALAAIDADALAHVFQASEANPLVGLDGRAALLRRLGAAVADRPAAMFAPLPRARRRRRGGIDPRRAARAHERHLAAGLRPRRRRRWATSGAIRTRAARDATAGLVPFHKLSQWLAYSLLRAVRARGHARGRAGRADRAARVPQRRAAARHRRAAAARSGRRRAAPRGRQRTRRRVARAHRRAGRRARARSCARSSAAPTCRSPVSSKAAPGRPDANSPRRRAAAIRRSRSTAMAPSSERSSVSPDPDRPDLSPIREFRHEAERPRPRPPARAAQAHADAQEGDQHDLVPAAAERDRRADGLRGHARHADARGRDRDAARDDGARG